MTWRRLEQPGVSCHIRGSMKASGPYEQRLCKGIWGEELGACRVRGYTGLGVEAEAR